MGFHQHCLILVDSCELCWKASLQVVGNYVSRFFSVCECRLFLHLEANITLQLASLASRIVGSVAGYDCFSFAYKLHRSARSNPCGFYVNVKAFT